jgi:hypothetical protein
MTDAERITTLEEQVKDLESLCRVQQNSLEILNARLQKLLPAVTALSRIFLKLKTTEGLGQGRN